MVISKKNSSMKKILTQTNKEENIFYKHFLLKFFEFPL
jgi:hypothetical protein